ncbi:unnamed protein product [Closterium sp. NIES-53]
MALCWPLPCMSCGEWPARPCGSSTHRISSGGIPPPMSSQATTTIHSPSSLALHAPSTHSLTSSSNRPSPPRLSTTLHTSSLPHAPPHSRLTPLPTGPLLLTGRHTGRQRRQGGGGKRRTQLSSLSHAEDAGGGSEEACVSKGGGLVAEC